jgi:plasmid maintenance system antidote protein VapI
MIALRLGRYFAQELRYWVNLQSRYDMDITEDALADKVTRESTSFKHHCLKREAIIYND